MLLTAISAHLSQRTFSGRLLCSSHCTAGRNQLPQEQPSPVSDRNQCINTPVPFILKGNNFEVGVLHYFSKFFHKIKFKLPTMIASFMLYFLLAALLFLHHFFFTFVLVFSLLASGSTSEEAVWKGGEEHCMEGRSILEDFWIGSREGAEVWYPVRISNKPSNQMAGTDTFS